MPDLRVDPLNTDRLTVVYCYPGNALPGIDGVPAGPGCTLESCTYRDRLDEFAAANRIQLPLFSDADLEFTTALRLPTFRLCGVTRLKRLTLVVDRDRTVRGTLFPIRDVTGSVEDALALVRRV